MSNQVMRYDVSWDGGTMKPEPDGNWVEIEDFQALEARAEKAEAERDALRAAINRAGALACQRASHAFIIDALKEADT